MSEQPRRLPIVWRGVQVGTLVDASADMYWWRGGWEPSDAPETAAFVALVEEGEDPQVLVGETSPHRLVVTALTEDEIELKGAV